LYRRLTEVQSLSTITPLLMGVFVYVRHTTDCPKRADRFWRHCRCPKWLRGTVAGREVRKSAKTRSWEKAEIAAHSIENGDISKSAIETDAPKNPIEPQRVTIRSVGRGIPR